MPPANPPGDRAENPRAQWNPAPALIWCNRAAQDISAALRVETPGFRQAGQPIDRGPANQPSGRATALNLPGCARHSAGRRPTARPRVGALMLAPEGSQPGALSTSGGPEQLVRYA